MSEGPDAAIRKLRDVADGLASSKKLFAKIAPYGRFHAVADWVRLQDYLFEWELSAGRPARARAVAEHMVKLSRGKDESWLERWARARDAAGAKGDA